MIGLAIAEGSTRQRRIAAGLVGALVIVTALVVPHASVPLPAILPFLSIFATFAASSDALTAYLLLSQARVSRSMPLFILATGYLFAAAIIPPHLLTFPGVFARPEGGSVRERRRRSGFGSGGTADSPSSSSRTHLRPVLHRVRSPAASALRSSWRSAAGSSSWRRCCSKSRLPASATCPCSSTRGATGS